MKKIHLCLIGITTLFLTACTVGVSTNKNSVIRDTDSITNLTVTFDFNGGTYNDSSEQVIFDDVKPTSYWKYAKARLTGTITPPTPHQEFKGFSFAQDDSSIIPDSYVVKENITVYAQYKAKEGEYCTVNWLDGGVSPASTIATEIYFEGDMPEFKGTIPYHEGKTFDHWDNLREIKSTDLGKSVEITAVYVPLTNVHLVTLDYGDGSGTHTQTVLDGKYAVEPKITKEGYKLDKWEYVSGGSGDFDFNTPIIEDIEIKAHWVKATYIVTWLDYDGKELKVDNNVEDDTKPVYEDDTHPTPTRKSDAFHNYRFAGWLPEPENIHCDTTYVATYNEDHYDAQAYMKANMTEDEQTFKFNYEVLSEAPEITIDWGDGDSSVVNDLTEATHKYGKSGEYNIRITGYVTSISPENDSKSFVEEIYLGPTIASLSTGAFSGCSNLKTVTFNDESQLVSISEHAFEDCSSLTEIAVPRDTDSVGAYAFSGCSNLKTVTFNDEFQLVSISEHAFEDCSSLTEIAIPCGIKSIGAYAFSGCSNLKTVNFDSRNKLASISDYVFSDCSSLTEITIPSSVTSIGSHAFSGCSNLKTVTFNDESQLVSISEHAFEDCSSLTEIAIPRGIKSIGAYAFSGCSSLCIDFLFDDQLASIGDYAFYGCSSLLVINIPINITSIGDSAFKNCSRLLSVNLSTLDTVPTLGQNAFDDCDDNLKLLVASTMIDTFRSAPGWSSYAEKITTP